MVLSKCCQEVVSLYWARLTKWPVGGCVLMPGSQRLLSVDICCVWESCGVCLWLHLNPPSLQLQPCLAEQTSSPARFACINCPCLARCLLMITLINFNSPGRPYYSSCLQTDSHTHTQLCTYSHLHVLLWSMARKGSSFTCKWRDEEETGIGHFQSRRVSAA